MIETVFSSRTYLPEFGDTSDGTPIKLHAAADTIDTGADHHDMRLFEAQVVFCAMVGQVQVVRVGGPFSRHCIDLLHHR